MLENTKIQTYVEAFRHSKHEAGNKHGVYDKPIVISATVGISTTVGVRIGVVLVDMVGFLLVILISMDQGYSAAVDMRIYTEFCWLDR